MDRQVDVPPAAAQPAASASPRTTHREVPAAAGSVRSDPAEAAREMPPFQDAELLALTSEFNAIEGGIEATCAARAVAAAHEDYEYGCPEEVEGDAKLDALYTRQRLVFTQIRSTRALTLEGVRAQAGMLKNWDDELASDGAPGGFYRAQMVLRLVQDLVDLPT